MKFMFSFLLLAFCMACNRPNELNNDLHQLEFITPMGDSIFALFNNTDPNYEKYIEAKNDYQQAPSQADHLIWYGRRAAYIGKYTEAIELFTEGINRHPADARMYRHRAHRYITTRRYQAAIADLEKATQLIEGKLDEVEPDGMPNAQNIPVSSLHDNIWYHLGLAYYLIDDLPEALRAFTSCRELDRNDDMNVSATHWLYMINRRMNQHDAAAQVIQYIQPNMNITENHAYHRLCLFYKGELSEAALLADVEAGASNDAIRYGLGNWYLYDQQDSTKAKEIFKELIVNGNKASFAYLAAEADYLRLFDESLR